MPFTLLQSLFRSVNSTTCDEFFSQSGTKYVIELLQANHARTVTTADNTTIYYFDSVCPTVNGDYWNTQHWNCDTDPENPDAKVAVSFEGVAFMGQFLMTGSFKGAIFKGVTFRDPCTLQGDFSNARFEAAIAKHLLELVSLDPFKYGAKIQGNGSTNLSNTTITGCIFDAFNLGGSETPTGTLFITGCKINYFNAGDAALEVQMEKNEITYANWDYANVMGRVVNSTFIGNQANYGNFQLIFTNSSTIAYSFKQGELAHVQQQFANRYNATNHAPTSFSGTQGNSLISVNADGTLRCVNRTTVNERVVSEILTRQSRLRYQNNRQEDCDRSCESVLMGRNNTVKDSFLCPTRGPTPTSFPTSTPNPSPSPSSSPTPTPTPMQTPQPVPTPAPAPIQTSQPVPTPTPSKPPVSTPISTPTPSPDQPLSPVPSPAQHPAPTPTPMALLAFWPVWLEVILVVVLALIILLLISTLVYYCRQKKDPEDDQQGNKIAEGTETRNLASDFEGLYEPSDSEATETAPFYSESDHNYGTLPPGEVEELPETDSNVEHLEVGEYQQKSPDSEGSVDSDVPQTEDENNSGSDIDNPGDSNGEKNGENTPSLTPPGSSQSFQIIPLLPLSKISIQNGQSSELSQANLVNNSDTTVRMNSAHCVGSTHRNFGSPVKRDESSDAPPDEDKEGIQIDNNHDEQQHREPAPSSIASRPSSFLSNNPYNSWEGIRLDQLPVRVLPSAVEIAIDKSRNDSEKESEHSSPEM